MYSLIASFHRYHDGRQSCFAALRGSDELHANCSAIPCCPHSQVVEAVNVPRMDWFGGRADPFVR